MKLQNNFLPPCVWSFHRFLIVFVHCLEQAEIKPGWGPPPHPLNFMWHCFLTMAVSVPPLGRQCRHRKRKADGVDQGYVITVIINIHRHLNSDAKYICIQYYIDIYMYIVLQRYLYIENIQYYIVYCVYSIYSIWYIQDIQYIHIYYMCIQYTVYIVFSIYNIVYIAYSIQYIYTLQYIQYIYCVYSEYRVIYRIHVNLHIGMCAYIG